ncbi:60S ribosomal protein L44 [Aspergillus campestris IBT 28561]|uniref:60S ribosomal protein L44 n=1 Tax=Aspergillus campestris (strain IBT 28561) TaxID=1392248 RepID=A0A2I1D5Y4_ASPC2|nr:60S ribosomal protein L44 [Aspergillus campestris IBT 28561]PKY05279.1 60S ribosomal protein L44 [Aspergillus campestris IBT 28561]
MATTSSNNAELEKINLFDQLLVESQHDPNQLQERYENHRSHRNAQYRTKLLSPAFPGWQADEILSKLHSQTTNPNHSHDAPFIDPRNNLNIYARPPQHIRDLVAEVQREIKQVAPTIWVTPQNYLHMTVLEMASGRTPSEIDSLHAHLERSGVLPELLDYPLHHRTRLVKPTVSYDDTAMALSFLPTAGVEGDSSPIDDRYTYHHLRRDMYGRVTATGLQMTPRYIHPTAHITIARFVTHEGFHTGDVVDRKQVASLVDKIEQINRGLREKYWPVNDGFMSSTKAVPTEWVVNVPKTRRTYCKSKDCHKHQQHKVTQYKAGKASLYAQGKRRYDRKQSGYGGQTKPVFHKKAKTTKKIVLRLECTACKAKKQLSLKRCKHFELGGDKKTKGAALVF